MSEKEHRIESRQGATVKIEHKRGTGTRDQDKVQVKVHTAEPVTAEELERASEEALEKTQSTMEELRNSIYTGEGFEGEVEDV